MKKILFIEGMSCQHCVMAAKGALMEVEGVSTVDVDLESKSATLEITENVSDDALRAAVEEAGYTVAEIK